jgi:HEAT repeat protein
LLTALGMQSTADVPDEVQDGLRVLVLGRPVLGRRWNDVERSHALTALGRLWPRASHGAILRVLAQPRESAEMVRAAAISTAALAHGWDGEWLADAVTAIGRGLTAARDPWTRGLLRLAMGRVFAADLESGSGRVAAAEAPRVLIAEVRKSSDGERGYAVLALALAARSVVRGTDAPAWAREAETLALEGVVRAAEDDGLRAAYAVALGLLGTPAAVPVLEKSLEERGLGGSTRRASAVALGQIGLKTPGVVRALVLTLLDRRQYDMRGEAALALSWLGTREVLPLLLREAQDPKAPEHVLAEVAVALGRLGALGAVDALATLAKDKRHGEAGRALAIVALGLVLDPEPRPSLLKLVADANYPARTPALHELLTIL